MRNYLLFESEFDRLKDLFLLEAEENDDDDLAEATNEESGEDAGKEPADKSPEKPEEESPDKPDAATDDEGLDLGEVTGDESMSADAGTVNEEPKQAPGAVNPKDLIAELTQSEDNIYDRVAKVARAKFPNGQCKLKDIVAIVAEGVTRYMENKKYIKLSPEAMKAVCLNLARGFQQKCAGNAKKPAQESAFVAARPIYETQDLMEGWKEVLLAGGLAAGAANAATAPSAPHATLAGTPRYAAQQQQAAGPQKEARFVRDGKAKQANPVASSVPDAANPGSVQFSKDSTYQMTPEQFKKFNAAGNLPGSYEIKKADQPSSPGKPSQTQKAVKEQAKSGKTTGEIARGAKGKDGGKSCKVDPEDARPATDYGKAAHELAHDAVDLGIRGAKTAWGAIKGAAKGAWNKGREAWRESGETQEKEHDKMIAERNSK